MRHPVDHLGVDYLSTRCPRCGDSVSMPPVCEPVKSADVTLDRRHPPVPIYAVLHLCTNSNCPGAVVAHYRSEGGELSPAFHEPRWHAHEVSDAVPERPRQILQSANNARHTSIACVAAAVKAVEAMMAEVGYRERRLGLQKRINKAVEERKLPPLMAELAHDVREIGNETHTDEEPEPLTTQEDAEQALKFANLLAEYLFVLPAEVEKAKALRNSNRPTGGK